MGRLPRVAIVLVAVVLLTTIAAAGDAQPLGSPHFTRGPGNMPVVTANIGRGLARVAPEHAAMFETNRSAFLARVAMAETRWKEVLAPFHGAGIVSYHDSWPYFYRVF